MHIESENGDKYDSEKYMRKYLHDRDYKHFISTCLYGTHIYVHI